MWRMLAHSALRRSLEVWRQQQQPPSWFGHPHVVVFAALPIEIGGFIDRLVDVRTIVSDNSTLRFGQIGERGVCVALTGPGAERARRVATTVLAAHRPRLVISTGFAGGLIPGLAVGDLVCASGVVSASSGERLQTSLPDDPQALPTRGNWVTVDKIVREPAAKTSLAGQFDAIAVEMESFAIADVCRVLNQPFTAVRAISDAVDDELPASLESLYEQADLARRTGRALGSVLRRPALAAELWSLYLRARQASDKLAQCLARLVEYTPLSTASR